MDMKLELVPVPVADVDRAKAFYVEKVGFNADHDTRIGDHVRVVQTREQLAARGVEVGEVEEHGRGVKFVHFQDPDGNTWLLQEMPWRTDVEA